MRLDLTLKQAGLIKRRTIAKELAEKGRVFVNDKVGKPSTEIKDSDILLLKLGTRRITVKMHFEIKGKKEIVTFEEISSFRVDED